MAYNFLDLTGLSHLKDKITSLLSKKQDIMQVTTMPTASASNSGAIIQYTGATTASYTNGYFYKCVENSGSYAWQVIQVQASGSGNYVQKSGDTMTGGLTTTDLTVGTRSGGTIGINSVSEGSDNVVSGNYAHAEGSDNVVSGNYAHAEGTGNTASGNNAHAEGFTTTASGAHSHAEGLSAKATANITHAEGYNTIAGTIYQHVQGKYNNNKSTDAFEIGNGTSSSARSNALELTWDGDLTVAGEITDGNGNTFGNKLTATVSGTSLVFSDSSILNTSIIEGPYILDGWTGITAVSYNSSNNSITYTFSDSSCDGKSAIIFVR